MFGEATEYQPAYKMSEPDEAKFASIMANADGDPKVAFDYWLRWKILTDLFFFGNEVMGWRYACSKRNYPKEDRRRYRVDPDLHRWLAATLQKEENKMIIVPRLHLKSTWVKLRIVQRILQNPNIRIGFFSVTAKLVRNELADIKTMLAHPMVIRLFKDRVPKPGKEYKNWDKSNQDELTVKRDQSMGKIPQEPQVTVAGQGAKITGFHFDEAYLDDVINEDTIATPEQMAKSIDWWQYLYPILETEAVVTITGTPYHYNDMYARIEREKQVPIVHHRSNVENGKPIYKSWYSNEDWPKMKKIMGSAKFNAQIGCNATPDEDKVFPPPQPIFNMPLPDEEKGYRYYCLIDPAATLMSYSDYTAFVIIAVNWLNIIHVVESFSIKKAGDHIADLLIKRHQTYGFKMIGIELGLQTHLKTIIDMKIAEYQLRTGMALRLPILPIPIKKTSKRLRIDNTLGALVRTGKFLINSRCQRLQDQMDLFTGRPGDEDDEVDAASMCVYVIETLPQHYEVLKAFSKDGMSWRDFHSSGKKKGWHKKVAGF